MFGYLVADRANLTDAQFGEYRAAYCGICSVLRKNGLVSGTLSLSYDLVFLWMLLTSMYEPDEDNGTERCPVHPFSGTAIRTNMFSGYVAAMGTILSYHKALDDWKDERNPAAFAASSALKKAFLRAEDQYPRQSGAVRDSLRTISEMEESWSEDIDALCNTFGSLMGEMFVYDERDYWSGHLREFGEAVGRYIYLLDAVLDLKDDIRHGRFNALRIPDRDSFEWQKNALDLFLGDVSELYAFLPVIRYRDVLDSIIYSGMTQRFRAYCKENTKEGKDVPGSL